MEELIITKSKYGSYERPILHFQNSTDGILHLTGRYVELYDKEDALNVLLEELEHASIHNIKITYKS